MSQLGHEREGESRQQHRDQSTGDSGSSLQHPFFGRKILNGIPEQLRFQKDVHEREHRKQHCQHRTEHQVFLDLGVDLTMIEIVRQIQCGIKPV